MRRNRIILLVLWVLALIGISVYGGQIAYSVFFLLTLIPVIALLYSFCVFWLFKIYQNLEGHDVICNHPADFYFTLQNESPVPFSGVRVLFYSSFSTISGLCDLTEYEFHPRRGIQKHTKIVCRYRGEYEVGIKKIVIQDFFRLFTISYRNREPFKVYVKPDTVRLTELKSAEIALAAVRNAMQNPCEPDVVMREYVAGDDPRLINWKVSGAAGKLMLRERIGEEQQGVGIIMESCRYSEKKEQYLPVENKILEAVIALNLFLSERGIPVTTYYRRGALETQNVGKDSGFEELYDRMAAYVFDKDRTAGLLYEEVRRNGTVFEKKAVFLVIHVWGSAAVEFVAELSRNHTAVIVYVVTEEEVLYDGAIPRTSVIRVAADAELSEVL